MNLPTKKQVSGAVKAIRRAHQSLGCRRRLSDYYAEVIVWAVLLAVKIEDHAMAPEVTVFLAENQDGWWVKLVFDDGRELWSEKPYPTREDADAVLKEWYKATGAVPITAQ